MNLLTDLIIYALMENKKLTNHYKARVKSLEASAIIFHPTTGSLGVRKQYDNCFNL